MCGAICKIIAGLALALIGLYMLVPLRSICSGCVYSGVALSAFVTVLLGAIPVFLILIGLLLVWIESEELKTEKEFKRKRK